MRTWIRSAVGQVTILLLVFSLLAAGYYGIGVWRNQSGAHGYLMWNLFLAWIPLLLSLWLRRLLQVQRWSDWLPLLITVVWLSFLPNTFYMLTDFIHLHDVPRVDYVFDSVMFSLAIGVGVALGFVSLALVHLELHKRLPSLHCWLAVLTILLLTSFAIYVGRELRWNTWDIVVHPGGILFDLSERIVNPAGHTKTYSMTATFFVALSAGYAGLWRSVRVLRAGRVL